jgi:hypothetical protein
MLQQFTDGLTLERAVRNEAGMFIPIAQDPCLADRPDSR